VIDHIELRTRDLEASVRFYKTVLAPLGYQLIVDSKAKGFGDARGLDFFLIAGEPADAAHYAFRSPDRATVRACYDAGASLNAQDRKPELAPHIHPSYYAGYLRDPDGRLVEFTCHDAE
jgi:catechol 2,3-dioxygenase-like lactoylglutathione lyase family enzyme